MDLATVFAIPLDKNRTGFVCMDVDLTERKHAEEALRESDRRKNEFLAMLSHEPVTRSLPSPTPSTSSSTHRPIMCRLVAHGTSSAGR